MKQHLPTIVLAAALGAALAGCGSSDGATTAEQDAAFKSGAKPNITIPPDANKPPANFKSSLDNGGGPHVPSGGAPGPGSKG